MDVLWAPWRMEYVGAADKPTGCIFCELPALPEGEHRAKLVLAADRETAILLNRYPFANGHLLVVPRRHVAWIDELPAGDATALEAALAGAVALLRRVLRPDGLNVGMNLGRAAGAGIAGHLHWHVVPRWEGDLNFMPVVAETKVMPEHLMSVYDRLHAALPAVAQARASGSGA